MRGVRPFEDRDEDTSGGVDGNIVGVVSRSEETSIALYNGQSKYSEWVFVASPATGPGTGGRGQPQTGSDAFGDPSDREPGSRTGGLRERPGDRTR